MDYVLNNYVICSNEFEQQPAKEKFLRNVIDKLSDVFNSNLHDAEITTLYHYTSIEALMSGMLQQRKENNTICLFASDSRCMNDNNEITTGKLWLKDLKDKYCDNPLFNSITNVDKLSNMFTISFSENKDMMPMWSTYGNRGDGIALGFDRKLLNQTLYNVIPCIYNKETFDHCFMSLFNSLFKGCNSNNIICISQMFVLCEFLLIGQCKNSEFEYEKEYRHLLLPDCRPSYRYKNNKIIPYHKVFLPKEALKQIIIGPNINSDQTTAIVKEYVEDLGFDNVKILKSKSPYRNL